MAPVPADTSEPPRAFGYARGVAPMLWALIALGGIELVVTHLLLAHWFPRVALALSALTLAALAWLIGGVLGFGRRPVLVRDADLLLRTGWLKQVVVPLAQVRAVTRDPAAAPRHDGGILDLALIAHPNTVVELSPPLRRRGREVRAVAHRLDDPDSFAAAVRAAKERAG